MAVDRRDVDGATSSVTVRPVIVVIGADGESPDRVTISDQVHKHLHDARIDAHHLAALTMHGAARGSRFDVVQITWIVCVIPALRPELQQLLRICRRVPRHHGRLRAANRRTFVKRLVIARETLEQEETRARNRMARGNSCA